MDSLSGIARGKDRETGEFGDVSETSRSSTIPLVFMDAGGLRRVEGLREGVMRSAGMGLRRVGVRGSSEILGVSPSAFTRSPRRRSIIARAAIRSPPVTVLLLVSSGEGDGDKLIGSGDSLPPVSLWKAIIRPAALLERMRPARMASRLGKGEGEVGAWKNGD